MEHEAWVGVEIRHLAALAAVGRESSFRGAAERLGYVQSAVSHQIANLERLVGLRLVDRSRGSKTVGLTDAGRVMVVHAEEILGRLHAARAELDPTSMATDDTTLRVGLPQSVATTLLPTILRRLAGQAPGVRVVPVEAGGGRAMQDLLEREAVDVAFRDAPPDSTALDSCALLADPCVLVAPADSEWAGRAEPPTLEELAALPLIALDDWEFQPRLEAWFETEGLSPTFALRAESAATLRAYVGAGLGAAITPTLGLDAYDDGLAVVDLAGIVPARRLALHWPRSRAQAPGLQTFRDVAVAAALELDDRRRYRPRLAPPLAAPLTAA